jgi:hypothetical protein
MKTTLFSALTATLLGFASQANGLSFDAADFVAIMFATGLVAWTITQYSRSVLSLTHREPPLRLPVNLMGRRPQSRTHRVAA